MALYDVQSLAVTSVSEGIGTFFAGWPELGGPGRHGIPDVVDVRIRRIIGAVGRDGASDATILLRPDLLVYVGPLGSGSALAAATFRKFEHRDALASATRRFSLTAREAEVLGLILRGMRAAEIARRLGLSVMTISDYFKRLRAKSGARTQSGMIAAMLGWNETPAP